MGVQLRGYRGRPAASNKSDSTAQADESQSATTGRGFEAGGGGGGGRSQGMARQGAMDAQPLPASDVEALGDLLADFLTHMGGFQGGQGSKEDAVDASPSAAAELPLPLEILEDKQLAEEPKTPRSETPKTPLSDTPSKKTGAHKRARSASEQTKSAPLTDAKSPYGGSLPVVLVPSIQQERSSGADDDGGDWRRRKAPRLGAHAAWLLAPGLTPDEKRLALPLLFNERLSYDAKTDTPAFAALERSVRSQAARLDDVFRSEGLSPAVTSTRRSRVEPSGEDGPFLKFVSAKLMPFSLEVMAETVGQFTRQVALPHHPTVETPPNVMFAKQQHYLRPDRESESTGVPILLRCVFQHTMEDDRMVGVWSGTGEWPEEMASRRDASAPIREQGWVIFQRYPASGSSSRSAASSRCLVQSCLYVTPGLSDGAISSDKSYLDVLSTVTMPSYQKLIEEREQILENRAMDRMLQIRMQQKQQNARPPGHNRSSSL